MTAAEASPEELRTARWVACLFLLVVLTQRFGLPNQPVPLLLPVIGVWAVAAAAKGVVVVDRARLAFWLTGASVGALVMLVQATVVPGAQISITAWGLIVAVWLPFVVRLVHRSSAAFRAMLRYTTRIGLVLASIAVVMLVSQFVGLPYRDWLAEVVPAPLLLTDFVITYPITYGSAIYKANAWIGVEPSMVSVQLGLSLLAAILVRERAWKVLVLLVGLAATLSGSGIVIAGIGLVVMLGFRSRTLVVRYVPVAVGAVVAILLTPVGQLLLGRSTEFQSDNSSTSLRALQPYQLLYPLWREHLSGVLLGYGPGSSQRLVEASGVTGLLVPSPVKLFFEYGLLAGGVLAAMMLACYWGGPSRVFAVSLLVSLWVLQPGTTTMVIVAPLLIFVSLWSPRTESPIEGPVFRPPREEPQIVSTPKAHVGSQP